MVNVLRWMAELGPGRLDVSRSRCVAEQRPCIMDPQKNVRQVLLGMSQTKLFFSFFIFFCGGGGGINDYEERF